MHRWLMRKCEGEDGRSIPEYPLIPTLSLYPVNELPLRIRVISYRQNVSNERPNHRENRVDLSFFF